MKAAFIMFAFMFVISAHAEEVPSGVQCMKPLRGQGMKMEDVYQACSLSDGGRLCVLTQQRLNAKSGATTKELAQLGKEALEKCKLIK